MTTTSAPAVRFTGPMLQGAVEGGERRFLHLLDQAERGIAEAGDILQNAQVCENLEALRRMVTAFRTTLEVQRRAAECSIRALHRLGQRIGPLAETRKTRDISRELGVRVGLVRKALSLSRFDARRVEHVLEKLHAERREATIFAFLSAEREDAYPEAGAAREQSARASRLSPLVIQLRAQIAALEQLKRDLTSLRRLRSSGNATPADGIAEIRTAVDHAIDLVDRYREQLLLGRRIETALSKLRSIDIDADELRHFAIPKPIGAEVREVLERVHDAATVMVTTTSALLQDRGAQRAPRATR